MPIAADRPICRCINKLQPVLNALLVWRLVISDGELERRLGLH